MLYPEDITFVRLFVETEAGAIRPKFAPVTTDGFLVLRNRAAKNGGPRLPLFESDHAYARSKAARSNMIESDVQLGEDGRLTEEAFALIPEGERERILPADDARVIRLERAAERRSKRASSRRLAATAASRPVMVAEPEAPAPAPRSREGGSRPRAAGDDRAP